MRDSPSAPSPAAILQSGMVISLAILILSNLVPIAGVLLWGWDAFVLLCLYWLETLVIGFWTILRQATMPRDSRSAAQRSLAGMVALAGFFTVHAGVFMTVHMLFLFAVFAGPWASRIHDADDFIRLIVIGRKLWIPLVALFAGQGAIFINDAVNRFVFARPSASTADTGTIMGAFYQRIVLMHVAILAGAFVAQAIGNTAPLIVLVLLKTAIEVRFRIRSKQNNPVPA